MRPVVTPEEMRQADEAVISAGTSAAVLMERAGRAVARAVLRRLGGRYGKRVTVVCGKGNNGGDGFVVARVLAREGVRVTCCTTFDHAGAKGAALHHLHLLEAAGVRAVPYEHRHVHADVIVDALFGTGFYGELEGPARAAVADLAHAVEAWWPRPQLVSVDVPSAGAVRADLTVALGAEKLQTFFADATSAVEVADIGIPVEEARVWVLEERDARVGLPQSSPGDHKTSHGTVVCLAGSNRTTGAALLTARGAARMGAGYVTLAATDRVIAAADATIPEILKVTASEGSVLGPDALERASRALERADAVAIGPGLGTGDDQRKLVRRALEELELPVVLDADALNVMADETELFAAREWPLVLTPHAGEMARLLDVDVADVLADRADAALRAAERFGCTVVLKGHRTLVAAPSGGMTVLTDGRLKSPRKNRGPAGAIAIPVGGPELATAGTGDVLTGAIAALLAHHEGPQSGAAVACYVHGVAGAIAARRRGPTGVVAWDVAEALPESVAAIRAPYPD
ncbi:MAG TPA: NAD(P)H-hydrate dehydratase [Actinomycetota bacterium]|nr:NAD(P)H-hydrate dehydratase [Actinomycetota bacterium]